MRRSSLSFRRDPTPQAKSLSQGSRRSHAEHLLSKLQDELYRKEEWALLPEVRNGTGMDFDVVRYADALAIHLTQPRDGFMIHGFELKLSRADFLRELRSPEKSGPLKLFCWAWYFVVLAPWKKILLSLEELPVAAGLIELATGGARIVRKADVREAEQPVPGFLKAFIRRAMERGGEVEGEVAGAPLQRVNRILGRWQVGLVCGHVALRPQDKVQRPTVPCVSCRAGLPSDRLLLEAMINEADDEELAHLRALIEKRAPRGNCGCTNPDAQVCGEDAMERLGFTVNRGTESGRALIGCHCGICHPGADGRAAMLALALVDEPEARRAPSCLCEEPSASAERCARALYEARGDSPASAERAAARRPCQCPVCHGAAGGAA